MKRNKLCCSILALSLICSLFTGCTNSNATDLSADAPPSTPTVGPVSSKAPKYVFLFIGDGMSYPQISGRGRLSGRLG